MANEMQQVLEFIQQHTAPKQDYGALGAIGGGLGSLILGNQAADQLGQSTGAYDDMSNSLKAQMDAMPTLAAMYGPDSPYAQQLQQTLARKDAAAGRNSQYGPRLAQLQALLAEKGSQYASQQAQMADSFNRSRVAAMQAREKANTGIQQIRAQQLASLFDVGQKTGLLNPVNKFLGNLGKQGGDYLSGLFGGNPNESQYTFQNQEMQGPAAPGYQGNASYMYDNPQDLYPQQSTPTGPVEPAGGEYDPNMWLYGQDK